MGRRDPRCSRGAAATEARRLDGLELEVRDLLAGLADIHPDVFDLVWHYELPPFLAEEVHHYHQSRRQMEEAEAAYAEAQRRAVEAARAGHLSLRDTARLLGLSFQRVSQLGGGAGQRGRARHEHSRRHRRRKAASSGF